MVPIKVFIFEDHWMCREALISVLGNRDDIKIVGALDSAANSPEEVMKAGADVVLMDLLFHGEKLGIKATSRIRKVAPDAQVIIFTEFPDEETLSEAVNAGASGFLLKNEVQDPEIIIRAIRAVHRGDAYMTPSMIAKTIRIIKRAGGNPGFDLTKRELQVLKELTEGKDNKSIAKELSIDERTVANHVSNVLFKMNAKNRTEAAAIARREGIFE